MLPVRLARRGDGCGIIRLTHLIGHIFPVDDAIAPVDHEDGTLEQAPFLKQYTVVLPEALALMC
jgi:hypothetical protein